MRIAAGALIAIAVLAAIYGLAFFHDDAARSGQALAEAVRPDHRVLAGLALSVVLGLAAGLRLRAVSEASSYLLTLAVMTAVGGAALAGLAHGFAFEDLHRSAHWAQRTWGHLMDITPGALGSLVGASSVEEGAVRLGAGAAKGLGRTLVDMVRHPGFEAIADGPLTLIVFLPLPAALAAYLAGIAPKVAARFHPGQPLWLRLSAQISLFAGLYLALSAVYLNMLVRQSANLAGTLLG